MAKRKPRKRYSRSLVVDFFEALHGNTKPCEFGDCPIVTAMDRRISTSDATTLDPILVKALDGYCRVNFHSSRAWYELTAADIVRITRAVMQEAA